MFQFITKWRTPSKTSSTSTAMQEFTMDFTQPPLLSQSMNATLASSNRSASYCDGKDYRGISLMIIGLRQSGKSTLVQVLRGERAFDVPPPTLGCSKPVLTKYKKKKMKLFDLGGLGNFRDVWLQYHGFVHGAIFVIDASNRQQVEEAESALFMSIHNPLMYGKPILIIANKADVPEAMSIDELTAGLKLHHFPKDSTKLVKGSILPSKWEENALMDAAIEEGLAWMMGFISKHYRKLRRWVRKSSQEIQAQRNIDREAKKKKLQELQEWRLKSPLAEVVPDAEERMLPLCSTCLLAPARRQCALSNWEPICGSCEEILQRSHDAAAPEQVRLLSEELTHPADNTLGKASTANGNKAAHGIMNLMDYLENNAAISRDTHHDNNSSMALLQSLGFLSADGELQPLRPLVINIPETYQTVQ